MATSVLRRAKPTRAQKVERTRAALLDAAAKVVGEMGYVEAGITAITSRAGVGQGTFYNYFESRQELFDQLLPAISEQMLEFIKQRGENAADEQEREEKSFRAFFDFLSEHPEFFRVMYEAEIFAPEAYERHTEMVLNGFVRILGKARGKGDIQGYDAAQIEALGLILMGARHYLCQRYGRQTGWKEKLPEKVVAAYMKLLRFGLYGEGKRSDG
jgi:AcrR family transcriptional regulator